MIAELHVTPSPAGTATDRWAHVDAAIGVVAASGLTYEVGALGTTFEGTADRVWETLRAAHDATLAAGAASLITTIRIADGGLGQDGASMASLTAAHRPGREAA